MAGKGNVHLVMPMAGAGSRFSAEGYELPKPLLTIEEKPFFFWAVQSVVKFIQIDRLIFIVLKDHVEHFQIDQKIREYYPEAIIEVIPEVLNGPVLTSIEGIKHINDEKPFIINDCDHMFRCDAFNSFCNSGKFERIGGAVLSFVSDDPKFSFLQVDKSGNVIATAEKKVISNQAICGVYYFESQSTFRSIVDEYLSNCAYKEYFISGLYNVLINHKKRVTYFTVDFHLPFGTPEEYKQAVQSDLFSLLL